MSQISIIVGAQWGDEGKGKWIDYFAKNVDIIARYQGGDNAGHTLSIDGKKYVFHHLPSAILHQSKICALLSGTVINPTSLIKELDLIDYKISGKNLWISYKAHIITPWHIYTDHLQEHSHPVKIGTTKKGIGPTYSSKYSRNGLTVACFIDDNLYQNWLNNQKQSNRLFLKHYQDNSQDWKLFEQTNSVIKEFSCDAGHAIRKLTIDTKEKKLLCEGAQGTLLDIDHGTYPFVTSSHTIASGALTSLGVGPSQHISVIGIAKAYCTRVGNGPFPTEDSSHIGRLLSDKGKEFGSTTGRKRRCGHLDLVSLKYAATINGFTQLIINKLDVLCDLDSVKVCIGYLHPSLGEIEYFPSHIDLFDGIKPIYQEFNSWSFEQLTSIKHNNLNFNNWPQSLQRFIAKIEFFCQVEVGYIGIGADRNDFIKKIV